MTSSIGVSLNSVLGARVGLPGCLAYADEAEVQFVAGRTIVRADLESRQQRVLAGSADAVGGISCVATTRYFCRGDAEKPVAATVEGVVVGGKVHVQLELVGLRRATLLGLVKEPDRPAVRLTQADSIEDRFSVLPADIRLLA